MMKIDVDQVLKSRIPTLRSLMPRCSVRWLERQLCQEQLNDMLDKCEGRTGADFCTGVLEELHITLDVKMPYGAPDANDTRVVIISNHPLGGLDGIALIHYFSNYYGREIKFVVNDLLMAIEPLHPVFLPINKHGAQSRQSLHDIEAAMQGDDPIIIFPAGLVSRRQPDGSIADLKWQKMFLTQARRSGRKILPVHFGGHNTNGFYNLAQWRKRLHVGINVEMFKLPSEVFKAKDTTYTLTIGQAVEPTPHDTADMFRQQVYALSKQ